MVLGVAIVGAGVIGQRMVKAVAEAAASGVGVAVVAVCDINKEAATALSTAAGEAVPVCTDFKELLTMDTVNVVYVGVPPAWHRQITVASLESGRHVICEKPLALNATDTEAMVEAAAKAFTEHSLRATVNIPFRQMPPLWAMKEAVSGTGAIGTPRRVEVRFRFPLWPRAWQTAPWVGQRGQGGPLREVGTHFYFLMQELFGGVARVRASVDFPGGEADEDPCEVAALGQFQTRSGVTGSLDLLTGVAGDEEVVCRVYGTKGTVTLTGWTELTLRTCASAAVVSRSGAYERKDEDTSEADKADKLIAGRAGVKSSPEASLLRRLAAEADGSVDDTTSTRELVTFKQAAEAQSVLEGILSSKGEWVSL